MKKLIPTFILITALLAGNIQAATEHVVLKVSAPNPSDTYIVPAGKLAEIVYIYRGGETAGWTASVTFGATTSGAKVVGLPSDDRRGPKYKKKHKTGIPVAIAAPQPIGFLKTVFLSKAPRPKPIATAINALTIL